MGRFPFQEQKAESTKQAKSRKQEREQGGAAEKHSAGSNCKLTTRAWEGHEGTAPFPRCRGDGKQGTATVGPKHSMGKQGTR